MESETTTTRMTTWLQLGRCAAGRTNAWGDLIEGPSAGERGGRSGRPPIRRAPSTRSASIMLDGAQRIGELVAGASSHVGRLTPIGL